MDDEELGKSFGVSAGSVRKQRISLGLHRTRLDDFFVIQVTEWLPRQSDTDFQCACFRDACIEHIVATGRDPEQSSDGYAVFRPSVGTLPVEPEPPKGTWVLHWQPIS